MQLRLLFRAQLPASSISDISLSAQKTSVPETTGKLFVLYLYGSLYLSYDVRQGNRRNKQNADDKKDYLSVYVLLSKTNTQTYDDKRGDHTAGKISFTACRRNSRRILP